MTDPAVDAEPTTEAEPEPTPEPPAAQELDLSLLSDTSFETLRAAVQEEWTRRRVVTSAPDEIAAITARADAAAVGRVVWAPITEPAPDA